MTDLILAIAHHFCVFTLAGLLIAEVALLRPGIAGARLRQLAAVDVAYGAMAVLVIVVGVLRVIFGAAGADYYIHNWVFWVKMAAFVFVGLMSAPPTMAILGWGRALKADPGSCPMAPPSAGSGCSSRSRSSASPSSSPPQRPWRGAMGFRLAPRPSPLAAGFSARTGTIRR